MLRNEKKIYMMKAYVDTNAITFSLNLELQKIMGKLVIYDFRSMIVKNCLWIN